MLPWNVVGFLNHCELFAKFLDINSEKQQYVIKLIKFLNIVVEEYLIFDQYYEEIRPFDSIH